MSFVLGLGEAAQKQQITAALDRTFLLVKAGLEARQAKETAKVTAQFSGASRLTALQEDINRLSDRKSLADNAVSALKTAHGTAQNVLERLNEAFAAAKSGNNSAFDTAINRLNIAVGSRGTGLDELIGNVAAGQTGARTQFIDTGATDVSVSLRALGSRFLLTEQGTGQRVEPNFYDASIKVGNQKIPTADLSLIERDGDTLTFTDGTDTWTADLKQGGLPVTSSWTYGGLTGDGQQRAIDDVGLAMKMVRKAINDLGNANLQGEIGTGIMQGKLDEMGDEALKLNDQYFDEMAAAKAAVSARYEMTMRSLAFAAQAQREIISAMVPADEPVAGSVFDILGGS